MASILRVNNNIAALNALRNLNQTTLSLNKTLQRLSSGLRIVSAADDPAGLIISEQLRAQVSSLKAAGRNVSEAERYFGIAESALAEINGLLVEMRALAVHAANGATSADQRAADDQQFQDAVASIRRIVETTRYAGDVVLQEVAGGGAATWNETYLIGEESTDTVVIQFADLTQHAAFTAAAGLEGDDLLNPTNAGLAMADVDAFQDAVSLMRGNLGATQKNTFQTRARTIAVQIENVTAAESAIRDANMAEETTNFTKYQILTQAGIAVLAQANVVSQNVLQLLG